MEQKLSTQVSSFLKLTNQVKNDYTFSQEEISRMDMLIQDYLHMLEFQDTNYHERAKIATALQQCRQLRRQHKDNIILLQPMVDMLETDKGKLAVSLLQQTLGQLRAAEKKMDNRTYSPRGMTPEEYKNKQTTIH